MLRNAVRKLTRIEADENRKNGVPDPLNDLVDAAKKSILDDRTKKRLGKKRKK